MSTALALASTGPLEPAENALHHIAGEAQLLGCLLAENELFDAVADILRADDFCEPLHQRIYETALHEAMAGRSANPATLRAHFADDPAMKDMGGTAYLMRLTGEANLLQPVADLARHLKELSRRRVLRAALAEAATACLDMGTELSGIADGVSAALNEGPGDGLVELSAGACVEDHMRSLDEGREGVSCGDIPSLDELLGPLRPGQLVICAGRPGMGKTALAISYALGAARRGHGTLFVSLEMSHTELGARMASSRIFGDAHNTSVPYSFIVSGKLHVSQREEVARASAQIDRWPLMVVDAPSLAVGRLDRLIRRHKRRFDARGAPLGVVIVDYLQLLRTDQPMRSPYETISEISRSLKAIAKANGVAIVALAQLSREVEKRGDKRPILADLRDSGQIEQDADAVLFLLREEYYLAQREPDRMSDKFDAWRAEMDAEQNRIEFILAKRRNGVIGTAFGEFHGAYQAVRG